MITNRLRGIVEDALGRPLTPDEDAGYSSLVALPPEAVTAAKQIREATNTVTVSVYLQHLVPSASLEQVREFMQTLE